jgi:hypothetical protein
VGGEVQGWAMKTGEIEMISCGCIFAESKIEE